MMWLRWLSRGFILTVTASVLYGLAPVVINQWHAGNACPTLGAIPACYLVMICYVAMAVSAVMAPRRLSWLFLLGWLPVFLLALTGSTMEILGRETCPQSPTGIPMCYYSFLIASMLIPAFWVAYRRDKSSPA
ncbi:MAG: hypothetical protein ACRBM6_04725 [Geminicoccales bacterium]